MVIIVEYKKKTKIEKKNKHIYLFKYCMENRDRDINRKVNK